jgi:hypothetical protein
MTFNAISHQTRLERLFLDLDLPSNRWEWETRSQRLDRISSTITSSRERDRASAVSLSYDGRSIYVLAHKPNCHNKRERKIQIIIESNHAYSS